MALGVGMALIALVYSCQKATKLARQPTESAEEGIPLAIAIPLTPEQATALTVQIHPEGGYRTCP